VIFHLEFVPEVELLWHTLFMIVLTGEYEAFMEWSWGPHGEENLPVPTVSTWSALELRWCFYAAGGVRLVATNGPIAYPPGPTVPWWNDNDREKPKKSEKLVTLSTTNSTWIEPSANPSLRDDRPATNRLTHGTAPN
jgi:hypothetical protein